MIRRGRPYREKMHVCLSDDSTFIKTPYCTVDVPGYAGIYRRGGYILDKARGLWPITDRRAPTPFPLELSPRYKNHALDTLKHNRCQNHFF